MGYISDLELLDLAAGFKGDLQQSIKNVELILDELTEKYEQSLDGLDVTYGYYLLINSMKPVENKIFNRSFIFQIQ